MVLIVFSLVFETQIFQQCFCSSLLVIKTLHATRSIPKLIDLLIPAAMAAEILFGS
jgi:hypothetical protein